MDRHSPLLLTLHTGDQMDATENTRLSYGIIEAALALGVSRSTVWRLITRGELAVFKILGRTLIPRQELERLINEGAVVKTR
jgi:excisionase family DNA binding protein